MSEEIQSSDNQIAVTQEDIIELLGGRSVFRVYRGEE